MPDFIGAIDQGTTSTRFIVFDRARPHRRFRTEGARADLSAARLGGARPRRDLAAHAGSDRRGHGAAQSAAGRSGGHRHHQPARNHRAVESPHRPSRSPTRWSGRILAWPTTSPEFSRDGGADRFRAKTGLPLATYFSGLKIRWMLDHVPGAREQAEAGDVLFGNIDTFLLWHLTGLALHRLHQRQPHAVDESAHARLGRRTAAPRSAFRGRFCREIRSSSEVYGAATLDAVRGVPVAGILGDQQAALVGQTCFSAGRSEEHLRHRLFPADEHRTRDCPVETRPAYHGGVPVRKDSPRTTRSKAASPSPARWCSGCAIISGSSKRARTSKRSPAPLKTTAASTSFPPFRDCTRRTGNTMRAA